MPRLLNSETGKIETLPGEDLAAAISSGKYKADPTEKYTVVDSAGNNLVYEGAGVERALTMGYRPYTTGEVAADARQRGLEVVYGGVGSTIQAGVEGVARGLTFGASDLLAEDKDSLRYRREVNPVASTVGEVAGAIAPAFFTGGAGAGGTAARILARTPAGLAARAGASITKLGAEAGLAGRVAAGAGGAAVEGALFGGGQVLSRWAMNDPNLTMSSALAEIGTGALLGGALGGGLPLAGAAVRGAVGAGEDLASKFSGPAKSVDTPLAAGPSYHQRVLDHTRRGEEAFTNLTKLDQHFQSVKDEITTGYKMLVNREILAQAQDFNPGIKKLRDAFSVAQKEASTAKSALSEYYLEGLGNPAKGLALVDDLASKATVYSEAFDNLAVTAYKSAFNTAPEIVAPRLSKEVLEPVSTSLKGMVDNAVPAEAYVASTPPKQISAAGKEQRSLFGAALDWMHLTTRGALNPSQTEKYRSNLAETINRIDNFATTVAKETDDRILRADTNRLGMMGVEGMEDWATVIARFNEARHGLQDARVRIAKKLGIKGKIDEASPLGLDSKNVQKWVQQGDDEAQDLLNDFLALSYNANMAADNADKVARLVYGTQASYAKGAEAVTIQQNIKALRDSLKSVQSTSNVKWDGFDTAMVLDLVGGQMGLDVSNIPVVGPVADWVLKIRTGAKFLQKGRAHIQLRKAARGAVLVGDGNEALSKIGAAARSVGSKSVSVISAIKVPVAVELLDHFAYWKEKSDGSTPMDRTLSQLAAIEADPKGYEAHIQSKMPIDLPVEAGQALAARQGAKAAFLASKAPKDTRPNPALGKPFKPSAQQETKLLRYVHGTERPLEVLDALAEGRYVTPEQMEAVTTVWPDLLEQFKLGLLEVPPEQLQKLPYQHKAMIYRATGLVLDDSLAPSIGAATAARKAPANDNAGGGGNAGKMNLPAATPTTVDKLISGAKPGAK